MRRLRTAVFTLASLRCLSRSRCQVKVELELERVMGIEPTLSAWEAEVLPLNYTRFALRF